MFEPHFGVDLANVRVHTGADADASARAVGARAYAVGDDVVFRSGAFAPHTTEGDRTLAHELTHVVQHYQGRVARPPGFMLSEPDDPLEREADAVSAALVGSHQAVPRHSVIDASRTTGHDTRPSAPKVGARATIVARQSMSGAASPNLAPPVAQTGAVDHAVATPPPVGAETFSFQGINLSSDPAYLRRELERYGGTHSSAQITTLASDFEAFLSNERAFVLRERTVARDLPRYGAEVSGVPQPDLASRSVRLAVMERILPVLRGELAARSAARDRFLAQFEHRALIATREILAASEARIVSEIAHYGLEAQRAGTMTVSPQGAAARHRIGQDARRRLTAAARELLARHTELVRAASAGRPLATVTMAPPRHDDLEARRAHVRELQEAYARLRADREREFPILAAYTSRDDFEGLAQIASGAEAHPVELQDQLQRRLTAIETVHAALGVDYSIWKQRQALDLTRRQLSIQAGTPEWRWIDERADEVQQADDRTQLAIGALAFALGILAAIPTGGSSLIAAGTAVAATGAAALSTLVTLEHIREYRLQSAAAGSDLDRALALARDEPSEFALALDVVGAIADIAAAGTAFRQLVRLVREVRVAAIGAETVNALRAAGNRVRPGLGDSLVAQAQRASRVASTTTRTVEQELAALGTLNAETEALLRANPALRRALVDNPLASRVLRFCHSPCWPPTATPDQIHALEVELQRIARGGPIDETIVNDWLALPSVRNDLANARQTLASIPNRTVLHSRLQLTVRIETGQVPGRASLTVPARGAPGTNAELQARAARVGVERGSAQAATDGLTHSHFANPFETHGSHGQGFDDIRWGDNRTIWVVEYKGGTADLEGDQMRMDWIIRNIRRLHGHPDGRVWANRLAEALRDGRLRGRVYRTPFEPPQITTRLYPDWVYPRTTLRDCLP